LNLSQKWIVEAMTLAQYHGNSIEAVLDIDLIDFIIELSAHTVKEVFFGTK